MKKSRAALPASFENTPRRAAEAQRDPAAVAAALDALRTEHEALLAVNEEARLQLETLGRVEDLLRSERARNEALFMYAPDAYVVSDLDGVISSVNIAAENLFGRDVPAMIGKSVGLLFVPEDHAAVDAQITAGRNGVSVDRSLRAKASDTREALVSSVVNRIVTTGELFWRFRSDERSSSSATETSAKVGMVDAPLRILFLVHDRESMHALRAVAESERAEVREVDSISAAVHLLKTFKADIVVADVFLQTDEGLDVITVLRHCNHRPMPVGIAVSAIRGPMDSRRALAVGFHAFLVKPVAPHAARSAIREAARVRAKRALKRIRRAT